MQGKIMSEQGTPEPVYVGIDVCKERLDIYLHPAGRRLCIANDRVGLKRLKQALAGLDVALVVMEATAKYHRLAQRGLAQAGFGVAVVNPLRARLFAEATGTLAKTDRVDAMMLAIMGAAIGPKARPPASAEIEALQELVRARSAATREMTRLTNRRGAAQTPFLKTELRRQIGNLERSIARLAAEIARRIAADPVLARRYRILLSIPGVGPAVAPVLLADCAELGGLSAKAAALARGARAHRPRHRRHHRTAPYQGRPQDHPKRPLHGSPVRRTRQPGPQSLPSTSPRQREKTQGRPHRRHAKTHHPRQYPDQGGPTLACQLPRLDEQHRCSPARGEGSALRRVSQAVAGHFPAISSQRLFSHPPASGR